MLVPSFRKSSPIEGIFIFARQAQAMGAEVTFASVDSELIHGPNLLNEIEDSGLPHVSFGAQKWKGLPAATRRLRRYLRTARVDVVLSCLMRADLLNALAPGPFRASSQRIATREGLKLSHAKWVATVGSTIHAASLRRMDCIFSMSEEMTEYLVSEGVDRSKLLNVNNFVDVKKFQAFRRQERLTGELNLGLFGRLIARKRVDVALRAFAELLGQNGMENARLHVAGDGPLREDLIGLSEDLELGDQVCFHGHLENPLPLMSTMDLVLLTSEVEGTPRCLMEAMSMGKTCVTSDIAGVRHLVVEGLTGYRFRPGDSTDLASRLHHIITMERYIPSKHLSDFMKSNFDAEVCSRKMLTHLEGL